MRSRIIVVFLLVTSLLFVSGDASQTPQSDSSEKPLYQLVGNEATVVGTIDVKGAIHKRFRIDMVADPVCIELNRNPETEDLITNQNRLVNAFVFVKGEQLNAHRFQMPDTQVVLEFKNCKYSPRIFGLRVGQSLKIVNSDPTVHKTHPTPYLNKEWNQTQAMGSPPLIKTFARAEVLIPFKCNAHPWERAYVGVMNHPFFAVTDEFGRFEIRGLPPGTYKLVVWHEKLGEQEVELTLTPGEIRNADFTYDADKKPYRSLVGP